MVHHGLRRLNIRNFGGNFKTLGVNFEAENHKNSIQDAIKGFFFSFRVHQIQFGWGSVAEAYSAPSGCLAVTRRG